MATVFFIIILGVIAMVFAVFLQDSRLPVLAVLVSLAAGLLIFLELIPALVEIFAALRGIAGRSKLQVDYLPLLLKAVAVAYLGEFAAQLCRDGGQGSIAQKIELGVKVMLMLMALPLLEDILGAIVSLLG